MTHGSLYSGIGGWLLAARWAGIENIFTVEIDEFCNKVLKKHFEVEQYGDIKEFPGEKYRGTIDILSTSDPCQPFSFTGKRGGTTDDRYLWPQTIRVIREIKPAYVVFENVSGFISMAFETVASDLETEGYTVESFVIPACAIGAWHRRDRLWVIAYTESNSCNNEYPSRSKSQKIQKKRFNGGDISGNKNIPNTGDGRHWAQKGEISTRGNSIKYSNWWTIEPNVGRVAHGIPNRVDRLKSLGNSIVPQIAYIIFEAIKEYEINSQDITHN